MFSEEAIKLAIPWHEAIKKIAEKQKCPECSGEGWIGRRTSEQSIPYTCPKCKGTGKGKWEWEPKATDWVLFRGQARILMDTPKSAQRNEFIPLLHWERIEEILKGMGYKTELDESSTLYKKFVIWDERQSRTVDVDGLINGQEGIKRYKNWKGQAKYRQPAVMRAVIKLGKEEKDEKANL